ncbi:MAG: FecR domain-containing protein [Minicystis sp.]
MSRRSFPQIDPSALRDHADEARVDRVWERIEHDVTSRADRFGPLGREARARRSTFAYVAIAAAFGAFGAGLWVGKATWDRKAAPVDVAVATPVIDKSRVEVFAAGTQLRTVALEGGGRLTLSPGTMAEVERAGTELTVSLLQGEASIDTAGRKQLAVVAGSARINTQAGSVLSVTRNADDIDVKVDDGTVSLSSPAGTQQLGKGERAAGVPIHAVVANAPIDAAPRPRSSGPARRPNGQRPLALKGAGTPEWYAHYPMDEEVAIQLLRKQGVNQAIDTARSAVELMAIADIMRGKGRDPAAEIRALERLVQSFSKDQRASLAAERLAWIHEARGDAARAKEYREKVRPLAEIATTGRDALLCELIRREPDKTKAAAAAKEYLDKYPDGECRDDFERLVQTGAPPAAPDPAPAPPAP